MTVLGRGRRIFGRSTVYGCNIRLVCAMRALKAYAGETVFQFASIARQWSVGGHAPIAYEAACAECVHEGTAIYFARVR
jgi:hypothetical protein